MKNLLNENKVEIDISNVLAEAKKIAEMSEEELKELAKVDQKEEYQTMLEVQEYNHKMLLEETTEEGEKE